MRMTWAVRPAAALGLPITQQAKPALTICEAAEISSSFDEAGSLPSLDDSGNPTILDGAPLYAAIHSLSDTSINSHAGR